MVRHKIRIRRSGPARRTRTRQRASLKRQRPSWPPQTGLVDERATIYYALKRDVDKGTLSILTSGKPDPSMAGAGGPPWTRNGKFAFGADGKTGYYLGIRALGVFTLAPVPVAAPGPSWSLTRCGRHVHRFIQDAGGSETCSAMTKSLAGSLLVIF
jgi:hypothetical protein